MTSDSDIAKQQVNHQRQTERLLLTKRRTNAQTNQAPELAGSQSLKIIVIKSIREHIKDAFHLKDHLYRSSNFFALNTK